MKDFYLVSKKLASFAILLFVFILTGHTGYAQAPTLPSSNLSVGSIDGDRFYVTFTRGDGARRIIVASKNQVTAVPVNGADYLAGDFGLGNEISPGQFVMYNGTGSGSWLYGFEHSTTYYLKIFEYNGSNFTTEYLTSQFLEGSGTTLTSPTVQASNLTFTNVTGNSMTVNWTKGDGSSRMVLARADDPVNGEPVDLSSYSASSSFGNGTQVGAGNFVVYNGTGSTVNITNLAPNRTYHFAIFEYNGSSGRVYLRPGATGSQTSTSEPTVPSSNFLTSSLDGDRLYYYFTRGNGTHRMVVGKKGSPVTAVPVDGQSYTASLNFGSGTEIAPGEFVLMNNTDNGSWLYNLEPNSTYHFAVFEYNGTGATIDYLTDPYLVGSAATLTGPTVQASNLTYTNITGNSMTVNWTKGDGSSRMVVARVDGPVTGEPVDLTSYSGSPSFGNGTQLGAGNFVVYNGSASSVNITNLAPNRTYHFAIFEYNGSSGRIYLRPGATGSQTSASEPTVPSSNFLTSSHDGNRLYYYFTKGNGTHRMVVGKKGSPVTAVPVDGQSYTASVNFGSGSEIAPGEFVLMNNTDNGSWVYKLEPNSTYHFAVFEYNGTGESIDYQQSPNLTGSANTVSAPTVQASNISFTNISGHNLTMSWTKGNGSSRFILARADEPVDVEPADLVSYGASTYFKNGVQVGNGNYAVYNGTGTSTTFNGLDPNRTYHFAIFEYNGSDGRVYLRPGATGSQLTASAPSVPASNFQTSAVDGDRFYYSFTRGNGTQRVVIAKKGSPVTAVPVNGQTYSASTTFGSGQEISPGEFVVMNGSDNGSWLYGLEPGTTYHFAIFEHNGAGAYYLTDPYLAASQATLGTPTVQSGNAFISSRSNSSINISWTRGDGSHRILIGRKNGPVNVEPQDFTNYQVSATFGTRVIGTDNYVLYANTGNNVNITSLESGTNYHFALFEYNGSSAKLYMRPGYQFAMETYGERPTVQASGASYSGIDFNAFNVNFTPGNGTRRLVLARAESPVNAGPSDFANYAADPVFRQGSQIGDGNFVVYNDFGDNFLLDGLEPGITYFLAFYEYSMSEQGPLYLSPAYQSSQTTKQPYDLNLTAITSPVSACELAAGTSVTIQVTNESTTPVNSFIAGYSINGSTPVNEVVSGDNLLPGKGSMSYTFQTMADLSADGDYTIEAFIILDGDVNQNNNGRTATIRNFPDPVTTITDDSSISQGQSITLVATGGVSYLWGAGETTSDITVQPLVTTQYTVTITDANGCSVVRVVSVNVTPDPCYGIDCPPGTICYDGSCFAYTVQVSGVITDADTSTPLEGVKVSNGDIEVYSDINGAYSLEATALTTILVSLDGYHSKELDVLAEDHILNVQLVSLCSGVECPPGYECYSGACYEIDPCTDVECPPGYECHDGACYPIDPCLSVECPPGTACHQGACYPNIVSVSGNVVHSGLGFPLSGVTIKLEQAGTEFGPTDAQGYFYVEIPTDDRLVFEKSGYETFKSEVVLESQTGWLIELVDISCIDVDCPAGMECYLGACIPMDPCSMVECPPGYECQDGDCTPIDPCSLIECPPGTDCYGGMCIPIYHSVSGSVVHSGLGFPLSGVTIKLEQAGTEFGPTDAQGYFYVEIPEGDRLVFEKSGYETFKSEVVLESQTGWLIELVDILCVDLTCPDGMVCYQGMCIYTSYTVSGTVYDAVSGNPMSGVKVDSPGKFESEDIYTDDLGAYTITVTYGEEITFSRSGYDSYVSSPVIQNKSEYDVLLYGNCDGVYCALGFTCVSGECMPACEANGDCPPGTICFDGACLSFDELCLNTNCPPGTSCLNGRCITDEDPCFNSDCPEGSYCLDGDCYIVQDPFLVISGVVTDKVNGHPLADVTIDAGYSSVTSKSDGSYSIKVPFGFPLTFSHMVYVSVTTQPMTVSRSNFNHELYKDYCLVHDCQPGQICVNGRCETIFYTISGIVRDQSTQEPLSGVSVNSGFAQGMTDENGYYSLEVILDEALVFTKDGYINYQTQAITQDHDQLNVDLVLGNCDSGSCDPGFICKNGECVEDPCADLVCPPGEFCHLGNCFPLTEFTVYGTVRDINTGEPVAASAVVNGSPTLVDYNGFFIVKVPYGEQILFIAEGYQWLYSQIIYTDRQVLEIWLIPNANCEDVVCPDGQICVNGNCQDPCEGVICPEGEVCFSGQCYPVDCETSLSALQVSPSLGTSETEFVFTISYADPANSLLATGYPRLELDRGNDGSALETGDVVITMEEVDPSDLNLADGKLYTARLSGLPDNVSWKARVVTLSEQGCSSSTPFIVAPVISVNNLDLAIYANNISFSNENPNQNEVITIFSRIRNISGFPAESFVVSAYDGDLQVYSTEIPFLAPNSFVDISWQYSFPEPGFYPIKVVIDETDVVTEINELNNFAIRPVLVGNYVLPGGIEASAAPNTHTVYVNSWINISGIGNYFGIEDGVNPSVAGANVTITYENGSFETTTGSGGHYSRSVLMPSVPGVYTFNVSVTDYTLTGHAPAFQVNVIPYPEKPDLVSSLTLNQTEILTGGVVTGVATVTNAGDLAAGAFTFRVSNCEGTIDEWVVSALNPGESRQFNFETSVSQTGSCFNINNCTFYAYADVGNVVDEKTKWNNVASRALTVYPPKPDLTTARSLVASSSPMDEPFVFTVKVNNIGGFEAIGPFDVKVYIDDVLVDARKVNNLATCEELSYPVEVTFASFDNHVIRITVDEPLGTGSVSEYSEDNNEFVRTVRYTPPPALRPNLNVRIQDLSVSPELPLAGETFEIKALVRNNGSAPIPGPVDVRFTVTADGVESVENVTIPNGLANGTAESVSIATSLPNDGNHQVLVELDPANLVFESSEYDNLAQMPLCVDFTPSKSGAVWNGGFFVDTQQNLTGRVRNLGLFTATDVKVTFLLDNVEIGSTVIQEVGPTYSTSGYPVSIPYTFREAGLFELKMVVDRPDDYVECHEDNNETAATIRVRAPQPDLRIVSEYISPTNLNPEMNEEVDLFVSFENIGVAAAQAFSVRVMVDDVPLSEDIRVAGLAAGQLTTVPVGVPYSSATAGIKVVRGIVDVNLETDDVNYGNNEATRAIVVGEAPNLLFAGISFSSECVKEGDVVEISVDVLNEGDMAADAEVHFYYVTETDTVPIDFVPVFVDLQSSMSTSISWTVVNPEYGIYAEIKNSAPIEYNDLDNSIYAEFEDTTPPTVITRDIVVSLDENGVAAIAPNDVDDGSFDNCGIAELSVDYSSFGCGVAGLTIVVTLTATDHAGNTATGQAEVLVQELIPPSINELPSDIMVSNDMDVCGAVVEWEAPSSADNCEGHSIAQAAGLASGSLFPIGATLITYRATDASGNTTEASFTLTVEDTQAPAITGMPSDVLVGNDLDVCGAVVEWEAPTSADNCEGHFIVQTAGPESGSVFPIGITEVTYMATDASGNTTEASYTVTVEDTQAPAINGMPSDILVGNDLDVCGAVVEWEAPTSADNCEGHFIVQTAGPESGKLFPVGTTLVTYMATDASGNTSEASFTVTVEDTQLPMALAKDFSVEINEGESVTLSVSDLDNGSYDNCGIASITISQDLFTDAHEGENSVNLVVVDVNGNISVAIAIVKITVIRVPGCIITARAKDMIVYLDKSGLAFINSRQVDNGSSSTCNGKLNITLSQQQFGCEDLGIREVQLIATDPNGNQGTTTFMVTVIDNLSPVFKKVPKKVSVPFVQGETYVMPDFSLTYPATDNCAVVKYEQSPVAGTVFNEPATFILYLTAYDASGNLTTASMEVSLSASGNKGGGPGKKSAQAFSGDVSGEVEVRMWPNPTTGLVYITLPETRSNRVRVDVHNAAGTRVISEEFASGQQVTLDLTGNVTGMYLVRMAIDGEVMIRKIVLTDRF